MIMSTLRFRLTAQAIFAGFVFICSVSLAVTPSPSPTPAGAIDEKLFKAMHWRHIGPFRGGGGLAIGAVPSAPDTYYSGAGAGGVWRATDGGPNWTPAFGE